MEPMDQDHNCLYRSQSLPSPPASPPFSPYISEEGKSDLSDMDVDSNSPPYLSQHNRRSQNVVSSASLDCVNNSLSDILSLKYSVGDFNSHNDVKKNRLNSRICHSTPPFVSTESYIDRTKTFQNENVVSHSHTPARPKSCVTVSSPWSTKTGYGLHDDDDEDVQFSHYPNSNRKQQSSRNTIRSRVSTSTGNPLLSSKNLKSHRDQFDDLVGAEKNSERKKEPTSLGGSLVKIFCILISLCVCIYFLNAVIMSTSCLNYKMFEPKVLEVDLKNDLFGQHIASELITKHLNGCFEYYNNNSDSSTSDQFKEIPSSVKGKAFCQPLVLSLHGWTGVGKNYASRIISQSFANANIRPFVIPLLFPHIGWQELYATQIHDWILSNISHCSVNLFIVDEFDKAFPAVQRGLLKTINSLTLSSSASSPVIFLLISNTHAAAINRVFIEKLNQPSVQSRMDIKEEHFHFIFNNSEQDEWYSKMSKAGLIDAFIPFLPLEKVHVIECIKRDLISKHLSTDAVVIDSVLKELSFVIYGDLVLSTTGCKRVADKVNYIVYNKMKS